MNAAKSTTFFKQKLETSKRKIRFVKNQKKMTSPWKSLEIKENTSDKITLEFEDNFEPTPVEFNKLPDSNEYLLSLGKLYFSIKIKKTKNGVTIFIIAFFFTENKLKKIKNDPNILRQLTERREECFRNLLNDNIRIQTEQDLELEAEVNPELGRANEILRQIRPEQPLSVGEIVHIIKHDHLDNTTEEEQQESDQSDSGASR